MPRKFLGIILLPCVLGFLGGPPTSIQNDVKNASSSSSLDPSSSSSSSSSSSQDKLSKVREIMGGVAKNAKERGAVIDKKKSAKNPKSSTPPTSSLPVSQKNPPPLSSPPVVAPSSAHLGQKIKDQALELHNRKVEAEHQKFAKELLKKHKMEKKLHEEQQKAEEARKLEALKAKIAREKVVAYRKWQKEQRELKKKRSVDEIKAVLPVVPAQVPLKTTVIEGEKKASVSGKADIAPVNYVRRTDDIEKKRVSVDDKVITKEGKEKVVSDKIAESEVSSKANVIAGGGAPEQGFEGQDVSHIDGSTVTGDWRTEYGPKSGAFRSVSRLTISFLVVFLAVLVLN